MRRLKFNKRILLKLAAVSCLFVLIGLLVYFPNYSKERQLRRENQRLRSKITEVEKEIVSLEERIKQAESDQFFLEKLAREDLGVARENEIVIDIEE